MELNFLTEAYNTTQKVTGYDPTRPDEFVAMIRDKEKFDVYAEALSEGLSERDKPDFRYLLENTRVKLMENSMFNFHPYEVMSAPILRNFYPRLIARDAVTTQPINTPDVIHYYMRAYFGSYSDVSSGNYPYQFPYVQEDRWAADATRPNKVEISRGPSVGINSDMETGDYDYEFDILNALTLTSALSHIEKDFRVTGATGVDATTGSISFVCLPDVDGNFFYEVEYDDATTDQISGHIDYLNGVLYWRSIAGNTKRIRFEAVASLEENTINSKVNYTMEKIRMGIVLREISGNWTIPAEQDYKALVNIDLQSELINIIGEQMAIEGNREIIDDLIMGVLSSDTTGRRQATFDKNPPASYAWGRKMWYENVQIPLSDLSAEVYNSNLMDVANVILANPQESALLESLNDFKFAGNSVPGGTVGYSNATVQGGKWQVLVSNIVPRGKMIMVYKSAEKQRATYLYCPYVPALLTPFPLGNNPSLTIMTRYAKKLIRPESIALLNIADTGVYHQYGAMTD